MAMSPLHNDGEFLAVVVGPECPRPCALVADKSLETSYVKRCNAVAARPATDADKGKLLVGWLHASKEPAALAGAQYTGAFVHKMAEPDKWKYGDQVRWCGGLTTEKRGVFVGWLLECKFGYARVQIDATGDPIDI